MPARSTNTLAAASLSRAVLLAALCCFGRPRLVPAQVAPESATAAADLAGVVVDALGKPIAAALVVLQAQDGSSSERKVSDSSGRVDFSLLRPGSYVLSAASAGRIGKTEELAISAGATQQVRVVLATGDDKSNAPVAGDLGSQAPEFSDKPNFSVAGVTDWTAVGGHGSDAVLRTSESLTRETAALKAPLADIDGSHLDQHRDKALEAKLRSALTSSPESYQANRDLGQYYVASGDFQRAISPLQTAMRLGREKPDDAYQLALAYQGINDLSDAKDCVQRALAQENTARLHRLAGQLDERLGDPLAAVRQQELATQLEPSELNYFDLGSELLLHRAVWEAAQTFADAAKRYPASARMKTAWGAALFAEARYAESARQLCAASDLDPASLEAYRFIGQIAVVSVAPEPCVRRSLERFVRLQPHDSQANYFLAMLLAKQNNAEDSHESQGLLQRAILLDPDNAEAHMQLGVIAFSQRQYAEAIKEYSAAVKADQQSGEAHYRLAVAYDRIGKGQLAKDEFRLHDQLEAARAEETEQQRRQIKQFVMASQEHSGHSTEP